MLSIDDLSKAAISTGRFSSCVRWYLRFKLSFRDLVEMMAERGISVAHTTIALDSTLCPGIRKALEPLRMPSRQLLARRRDLREDQRPLDLPLSRCRQRWKNRRFPITRETGCCGGESLFPAGVQEPGQAAARHHA